MWRRSFRWSAVSSIFSFFHSQSHQPLRLNSKFNTIITSHFPDPDTKIPPVFPIIHKKPFCSNPTPDYFEISEIGVVDAASDGDNAETLKGDRLIRDVDLVMDCFRNPGSNCPEAKRRLQQCKVVASPELVSEILSRLRNDWTSAFTFFLWVGKQPGYAHSIREYHSMISILGKLRKFDTAWSLVGEMRGATPSTPSLVSSQTLMILIRKYSNVHDVAKAIGVFYSFKKFGLEAGLVDFQGLLSALCRYKNVAHAEHLLMCNEHTFPFETKSFNIVLNGWCNGLVSVREAKRFWAEFDKRTIPKDVVSYCCMISCYSKSSNLHTVMNFFRQMEELSISPDVKVYNAIVFAFAKAKRFEKAKYFVKIMEEKGISSNVATFNSLIGPLCKFRRIQEAREVFVEMSKKGITPSIRTFHAFFDMLNTERDVFELLDRMRESPCKPIMDTYVMLIRKLCRWRGHDSIFRLWGEITESSLSPDRSAYIVLIHGLFLNGRLEEASKYYEEMKEKGFEPEPKTEEMIEAWLAGKVAVRKSTSLTSITTTSRNL